VTGRKIAVIGGGVSGLTAAYVLSKAGRHVTMYEADDRLCGHADTHLVTGLDGHLVPVDTGSLSSTNAPIRSSPGCSWNWAWPASRPR
jgi:predicted NAD/FAD-binding protein